MTHSDLFDTRPKVKKRRQNILPKNPEAKTAGEVVGPGRFPSWLHRKLPKGGNLWKTGKVLGEQRLHTVCEEAKCPNLLECWTKKTATFLIMGKECTRSCGFCDIDFAKAPSPLDPDEPRRVAESVKQLGLKHVVITMVARDDQPDGGANHLAAVVCAIRELSSSVTIEVLTSDFAGNTASWETVMQAKPDIFNYNIETVRDYTPRVRHKATYERTLAFLSYAHANKKNKKMFIKSGLMVGFGESEEQVQETIQDLHGAGVQIITIGQYLQPNQRKLLVKEFVHPDQFKRYEEYGVSIGIQEMYCGPFVRSSYNAGAVFDKLQS